MGLELLPEGRHSFPKVTHELGASMISPIVRKWTIYSLVTTAVAAWICFLVSFFYFHDGHLPNYSQPSMGRIYESNNHGSKVYLTKSEHDLVLGLQILAGIVFVVAFLLNKKWRVSVHPLEGMTPRQRENIRQGRPPFLG